MSETAREHFERTKLIVHGAPDSMEERRERWYGLEIDGVPFGDHFTNEAHFDERAALAMVLVSCGADEEILRVRRLDERQDTNTADFEAVLKNGQVVRIELTQINDAEAMQYQNQWNAVFDLVQRERVSRTEIATRLEGLSIVFEMSDASPNYDAKEEAAEEILAFLLSLDTAMELRRPIAVGTKYPILSACGATCYIAERAGTTSVKFRLPLGLSDVDRILESVPRIMAKKGAKFAGYSDNGDLPVWLAVFARDEASGFNLAAIQELASDAKTVTVEPFDRLLIGNTVAGLSITADRANPAVYRSLSVPYREFPRR